MAYPKETSNYKERYGIYLCHCGKKFKTMTKCIKNGDTKSCGCTRHINAIASNTKHGLSGTRIMKIFSKMLERTQNKNHKHYDRYGGRGIIVCEEWKNDPNTFANWANENGYENTLTIDRKNNSLNYTPDNCRWITREKQQHNTDVLRKTNTSGYRGVSFDKRKNKYYAGICVKGIQKFLGYFDTAVEGAFAYDNYIFNNNLNRVNNGLV